METLKRRLGPKLLVFVLVVSVLQVVAFHHYNAVLGSADSLTKLVSLKHKTATVTDEQKAKQRLARIQKDYPIVDVSPNGVYAAYVNSANLVRVVNLDTGDELSHYAESGQVVYVSWIRNDQLFVGLRPVPGELQLTTLVANSGQSRLIHTYQAPANATFYKITDSYLTNDTYVLIANSTASAVYHWDTDGNENRVHLGGVYVKNVAVSLTHDILYYEAYYNETFNVNAEDNGTITTIQPNGALIDVVNDTLYYGTINSQGLVTAVYRYDASTQARKLLVTLAVPTLAEKISVTPTGKVVVHRNLPQNLVPPSAFSTTYSSSSSS